MGMPTEGTSVALVDVFVPIRREWIRRRAEGRARAQWGSAGPGGRHGVQNPGSRLYHRPTTSGAAMGEDTLRREGAQTLAARIRCFWIERGYASPSIVVEKIERLDK